VNGALTAVPTVVTEADGGDAARDIQRRAFPEGVGTRPT
jgi:hypothetical protein